MSNTDVRSKTAATACGSELKLPRRDWVLLPMLSLFTICLIVGSTKWAAGRMFWTSRSTTLGCLVLNDPLTGVRAIPNTVCTQKSYESELVEYRFNSCGHRAGMDCGPKPPGTYRIVMVGSSFNFGMHVRREQSFAALLPAQLSQQTGHKVELYNEAMQWGFPASAALRFHQVFAARPDMILWVLTPMDIASSSVILPFVPSQNEVKTEGGAAKDLDRVKVAFATHSAKDAIALIWNHAVVFTWDGQLEVFRGSPSGIMLQHALYASQSLYMKSALAAPDSEGGFLKAEPSPDWESKLRQFDRDAAEIEGQARTANVPFVAVLVPDRAQAAMLSVGEWPTGYDPYKLDAKLRAIIVSHGGTYIDILPGFRSIPDPEQHYFPVDGHPDANGHTMISILLAKELTNGAVPALTTAAKPQSAGEKGK